jgi:hypothetical protein
MAKKTYLVQTWDKEGVQKDHYEVVIETDTQLRDLRKFLGGKFGQVLITRQPDPPKRPVRKR